MGPRDLAYAVTRAINARDRAAIQELTTEDIQLRFPPRLVFYGRVEIRDFVDELERRIQDLTMVVSRVYAGDDFAVAEWDATGQSATSERVDELGCLVLQLRDGKIARAHLYADTSLWRSLGEQVDAGR